MDATSAMNVADVIEEARSLWIAKTYSLACCVMLFYDIVLTTRDEVERIWKRRFTFATVLYFMNRYLSPLGFIVVLVSWNDPDWGKSACNHYVLFPEILKVFTCFAIGCIFTLRLYSIYGCDARVLYGMGFLLAIELGLKIWAFTDGVALPLPAGLVGCILTGRPHTDGRFVTTWVAELVFDTVVFILTTGRTLHIYRTRNSRNTAPLLTLIMRDGIMYFAVIFSANLITVVLFCTLPESLKAINASFSTLITSLMVSRLILNLRGVRKVPVSVYSGSRFIPEKDFLSMTSTLDNPGHDRILRDAVIGNLGGQVRAIWNTDDFTSLPSSPDETAIRGNDIELQGR